MGDWIYWLSWLLGIALTCGMIYIAWWALFRDRPNGRRRCPKCWYDLSYAPPPGLTCSECGFTARHERELLRTRRRYSVAIAAMLTCAALVLYVHDLVGRTGWSTTMPSGVLLLALPYVDHTSAMYHELTGRALHDQLSSSQLVALMERCAKGDSAAPLHSDAWRSKYGLLIRRMRSILATADDGGLYTEPEHPLTSIPPLVQLIAPRDNWEQGETAWVVLTMREWWPHGSEARLVLSPQLDEADSRTVRYATDAATGYSIAVPLGSVKPGQQPEIAVEVEAFHRREGQDRWISTGSRLHTVTLDGAESVHAQLEPVDEGDESAAALISRIFLGHVVRWPTGPSPVRFSYRPFQPGARELEALAIGVSIELQRGEQLARRLELWWLAGAEQHRRGRMGSAVSGVYYRVDFEDLDLLAELDSDDDRWRMFVRGDENIARRVAGAERFWNGELELPVTVESRPGEAPARGVWIE